MRARMADEPQQRLAEGQRLLDAGDLDAAVQILAPLTGHPDADLSGAAWLAIGNARYRLDDEAGAMAAWRQAALRGGASSWIGWRSVAEQEVRDGNLVEAVAAYREADRRAPPEERGAIANRIARPRRRRGSVPGCWRSSRHRTPGWRRPARVLRERLGPWVLDVTGDEPEET